jgi:hypothetical protein
MHSIDIEWFVYGVHTSNHLNHSTDPSSSPFFLWERNVNIPVEFQDQRYR